MPKIIDAEFEVVSPGRRSAVDVPGQVAAPSLWARLKGPAFWAYFFAYFPLALWWVKTHP